MEPTYEDQDHYLDWSDLALTEKVYLESMIRFSRLDSEFAAVMDKEEQKVTDQPRTAMVKGLMKSEISPLSIKVDLGKQRQER
jgi:hypothetical protein